MRPLVRAEIADTLQPARIDRIRASPRRNSCLRRRHLRAQVLLRKSRRHRDGRRLLRHRHRALIKQLVAAEGRPETPCRQQRSPKS